MRPIKLFLFLIPVFFCVAAQRAEASISLHDTASVYQAGNINLEFVYADKSRIAIETADLGEGQTQIGFYPSTARVIYKVSGTDVVFRAADKTDWIASGSTIEANKIVIKSGVTENIVTEQVVVDLPKIDKSISTVSTDKNLTVQSAGAASINKVFAPVKNGDKHLISSFYEISTNNKDMSIQLSYQNSSVYAKDIYYYDQTALAWQPLTSYHDVEEHFITADIRSLPQPLIVAIFEDYAAKDGIASFYDQSWYKTFGYKNGNFAASRDFPKGTRLKVTRLKTGDSVVIEVNDYGPEAWTGRVIDLDVAAFEELSSRGAGLIYVRVEPLL